MKRRILSVILMVALIACLFPYSEGIKAADTESVKMLVHFEQGDARKMFDMVNTFRASAGTEEDENQYPLTYDYELEKVAMQRAAELAVKFSDKRPDGSIFMSALKEYGFDTSASGPLYAESILFGSEDSMKMDDAFQLFCDTPVDRINLLGYYNTIGIGHVRTEDKIDIWVQLFATSSSKTGYTEPVNSNMYVNIKVPQSIAVGLNVSYVTGSQSVGVGETTDVPIYLPSLSFAGSEIDIPVNLAPLSFESNDGFVKAEGDKMTGLKEGSGKISTTLLGQTFTYDISVTKGGNSSSSSNITDNITVLEPTKIDSSSEGKDSQNPTPVPTDTPVSTTLKKGDTFSELGLNYKVLGSGKAEFSGVSSKMTISVSVPATVKHSGVTYKVVKIADKALYNNTNIMLVEIGKNVKTIGKQAFYGCSKINQITFLGKSLTKIGSKAFTKMNTNAVIQIPKSAEKKYKKLFKSAKLSSKVKINTY